jgi:hypothetical protein
LAHFDGGPVELVVDSEVAALLRLEPGSEDRRGRATMSSVNDLTGEDPRTVRLRDPRDDVPERIKADPTYLTKNKVRLEKAVRESLSHVEP